MMQGEMEKVGYDSYPNEARNDMWKVVVSDIPDYTGDMLIFDSYIKSFMTPTFNLDEVISKMMFANPHPLPKRNDGLYDLSLTMSASEGFENYAYLVRWWHNTQFGNYKLPTQLSDKFIGFINIHLMDNQKNKRMTIKLSHGTLVSIAGLNLVSGASDIHTFDVALKFRELNFAIYDKNGVVIHTTDE